MVYDPKKDREIKSWRITVKDHETAIVSLKQYDGGDPRLQIGPLEIKKPDGELVYARIKRWGWDELHDLRDVIDEAIELMDEVAAKKHKTA